MKFGKPLKVFTYICIAQLIVLGEASHAQDGTNSNALDRFGGLGIERTAPTIDRELAQKMFRRGNTYNNLQRYEEAIEEYRKAISADPNFSEAIRTLANIYYFLERFEEAKPLLARFIESQASTSASLIAAVSTLGELERQSGNFEVSIGYDLQAIKLDPQNDSQIHIMANTYNNSGDAEKAIQIYLAGIEVMPTNAFFDRNLGRILEQQGQVEKALVAYESALEKEPESEFYKTLVDDTRQRLQR